MDSFEQVVASILRRSGYWTQTEVKVDLQREEKKAIGRPSRPRWEDEPDKVELDSDQMKV